MTDLPQIPQGAPSGVSMPAPQPRPEQTMGIEGVVHEGKPYLRFTLANSSGVAFAYMPAHFDEPLSAAVLDAGGKARAASSGLIPVEKNLIVPNGGGPM